MGPCFILSDSVAGGPTKREKKSKGGKNNNKIEKGQLLI
jgi:hypothetical protein